MKDFYAFVVGFALCPAVLATFVFVVIIVGDRWLGLDTKVGGAQSQPMFYGIACFALVMFLLLFAHRSG